jgi:hypothetical protein
MTLLEVLVAVGITMIIVAVIMSMGSNSMQVMRLNAQKISQEEVRNQIRLSFSCQATLGATPNCPPGTSLLLKSKSGKSLFPLLAGNITKYDKYRIRAHCATANQILVEIKPDQTGAWQSLFKNVPLYCPAP